MSAAQARSAGTSDARQGAGHPLIELSAGCNPAVPSLPTLEFYSLSFSIWKGIDTWVRTSRWLLETTKCSGFGDFWRLNGQIYKFCPVLQF
jgi:hypothetical protein